MIASQYILYTFQVNFIASFDMKSRCACCNLVTVEEFSKELWLSHKYFCPLYFSGSAESVSVKLRAKFYYGAKMCI